MPQSSGAGVVQPSDKIRPATPQPFDHGVTAAADIIISILFITMKRGRDEEDDDDMPPITKEAKLEDPIAEHFAALSSRALLPELLNVIFRSLHISDQLMVMAVSRDWRRIVIPIIVEDFFAMLEDERNEALSSHSFWRNSHGYEIQPSLNHHDRSVDFYVRRAQITPYGIATDVILAAFNCRVWIDMYIYRMCDVCKRFSRRSNVPYGNAPICSQPCLERLLDRRSPSPHRARRSPSPYGHHRILE